MELCLYEPELGYYSRAREQFGKAGDFYTSSDVHAVFGRLLARQFEEMWRALGFAGADRPDRARPGTRTVRARCAGLVGEAVSRVRTRAALCARGAVGTSARAVAGAAVRSTFRRGRRKCSTRWRRLLRLRDENVIVFGNEFFDALPVEMVDHRGAVRVGIDNGRFVESFVAPSAAERSFWIGIAFIRRRERVEATLASLQWMERIAEVFRAYGTAGPSARASTVRRKPADGGPGEPSVGMTAQRERTAAEVRRQQATGADLQC